MKKSIIITTLFIITVSTILSACNTTRGVGRDISAAGRGIQRAAR